MVHALDQQQLRLRLGLLQQQRLLRVDLEVAGALDDQRRDRHLGEGFSRALTQQGDQVGLHARPQQYPQLRRNLRHHAAAFQFA